jgi:hypothetical protein
MRWEPITKSPPAAGRFNLADYERACGEFSWSGARRWLDGLPGGGLNIAYEAVDRHACGLQAIVKAFVTLKPGHEPTEELRFELVAFGRRRLGAVAPKEIEFAPSLPLTRSAKIMRRLLKARELGLPEGDVSTLGSAR